MSPGMALVTDVPAKSCGGASLKLTSGVKANATDLYQRLSGKDELFVRYYAKYQAGTQGHHTGVRFGGYTPPTPYPNPMAGLKPNGDDRFSVSIEPVYGVGAANLIFLPIATRLRVRARMEALRRAITIDGILALHDRLQPSLVEERLTGYLRQPSVDGRPVAA